MKYQFDECELQKKEFVSKKTIATI